MRRSASHVRVPLSPRRMVPVLRQQPDSSTSLDDFLAGDAVKAPRRVHESPLALAKLDARARSASGDWAGADASALVGLYALCHESVYGVHPAELETRKEFQAARGAAVRLLASYFDGDADGCAAMVSWRWVRERGKREWMAKQQLEPGKRLGWRFVFSIAGYVDWRACTPGGAR